MRGEILWEGARTAMVHGELGTQLQSGLEELLESEILGARILKAGVVEERPAFAKVVVLVWVLIGGFWWGDMYRRSIPWSQPFYCML